MTCTCVCHMPYSVFKHPAGEGCCEIATAQEKELREEALLMKDFEILHQLASVKRYSRDKMTCQESVLEHLGFVALFCFFVNQQFALKLDPGVLLQKALAHDLEEAVFGDVARTTKYVSPELSNQFKIEEAKAIVGLARFLGIGAIESLWNSSKTGETGMLVALADFAAVVFRVWSEVELNGNQAFMRVAIELESNMLKSINAKKFTGEIGNVAFRLQRLVAAIVRKNSRPSLTEFMASK